MCVFCLKIGLLFDFFHSIRFNPVQCYNIEDTVIIPFIPYVFPFIGSFFHPFTLLMFDVKSLSEAWNQLAVFIDSWVFLANKHSRTFLIRSHFYAVM